MTTLEIDIPLIEKIIRKDKQDVTAHVTEVNHKNVGGKGDNYTSEVKRILIKYISHSDQNGDEKELSLFIKHMRDQEHEVMKKWLEFPAKFQSIYNHEMAVMMGPLEKINRMLTMARTPRLLYYNLEEPYFAIMEDLIPLGYTMVSRSTGLDLSHSLLAIRGLAEFHASSIAVHEEIPEYKEKFIQPTFDDPNEGIQQFFINGLNRLASVISKWKELGPKYEEKLKNLAKVATEKSMTVFGRRDNEFTVLSHGDCSQLNMMFAYDAERKPSKVALVDFQMSYNNSPVVDLLTLISSSMNQDVYQHHQQTLLQEYHSVLSETMKKLNCTTSIPSLEDIKTMYQDRIFITVLFTCVVYPIIHAQPSDVVSLDAMIFDSTEGNTRYEDKHFRELLTARLIEFDNCGLLNP